LERGVPEALRVRLEAEEPPWGDVLVQVDAGGVVRAGIQLIRVCEGEWGLSSILTGEGAEVDGAAATLVAEALAEAVGRGAHHVSTRPGVDRCSAAWRGALVASGFACGGRRVEYRRAVAGLPDEVGSPLQWSPAQGGEAGLREAAALAARCSEGDPDGLEPGEDPVELLRGLLESPGLTTGMETMHLGSLDGEPVAFVFAQVASETGWARVTFMGLVPEVRGRGLGTWVHRHGFAMMTAQGGRLYHGGTHADNHAMRALFAKAGCKPFQTLELWTWRATR